MSKPSAKKKKGTIVQPPVLAEQPVTHLMVPLADAQKMFQVLGEVPCKFGVAWVIEVLGKAPQGAITATRSGSPAKKTAPPC